MMIFVYEVIIFYEKRYIIKLFKQNDPFCQRLFSCRMTKVVKEETDIIFTKVFLFLFCRIQIRLHNILFSLNCIYIFMHVFGSKKVSESKRPSDLHWPLNVKIQIITTCKKSAFPKKLKKGGRERVKEVKQIESNRAWFTSKQTMNFYSVCVF